MDKNVNIDEIKYNTEYEGIKYETIANELHMELFGKLPEEGHRHNQYVRVAAHMRSIVDNNHEWLYQVMPKHGWDEDEEMKHICKDMCKDICKGDTKELKKVLDRLHKVADKRREEKEPPFYMQLFQELEQKGWPMGYKECMKGSNTPEERLISFIAVTSAMTPFINHIKYRYADNRPDRCILQVLICAPSAAGKTVFADAVEPLRQILEEGDNENLKKMADWSNLSKKEKEETPEPKLPLLLGYSNVTEASLRKLVFNGKKHTTWFTSTEAAAATIDIVQDILCRGYDGQKVESFRATDTGVTGRENAYISYMMTGTEDQIYNILYAGGRGQNGTGDRPIPCIISKRKDQGIPWYEQIDDSDTANIREAVKKLREPLEGELDVKDLWYSIREWVLQKISLSESLSEKENEAVLQIKNRSAKNGLRAAIPYLLLTGDKESANKVMLMVAEYCFQMRYRMWKTWYNGESKVQTPVETTIAEGSISPENNDMLKIKLGEYFKYSELYALFGGNKNAAQQQISRWKRKHFVEESGHEKSINENGKTVTEKKFHNLLYARG